MSTELADLVLAETADKMANAVSRSRHEFATIRTGRASSAFVEKLPVDYYGSIVPLQQLAGFSVPEARQLVISPYDKGSLAAIEKALRTSDLGLSPNNDGSSIRLNFPPLTAERRKDFVKVVRKMAEEGRIALRNLRRAARHELEGLEKDHELSTDELARYEKELDKLTHTHEGEIDQALEVKEKELLED